jgi:myo-inositol-hexaphosphate 3-phosphohydrolase
MLVVDDAHGFVYFGQEAVGIWKPTITNSSKNLILIDKMNEVGVPYTREWDDEEEECTGEILWDLDPGLGSGYLASGIDGLTIYDAGKGNDILSCHRRV